MSTECCSQTGRESSESSGKPCCSPNQLALFFGAMLLRLWLGIRALQTGIEKFAGTKASEQTINIDGAPNEYGLTAAGSVKYYALENYHGVPPSMLQQFQGEPLMLGFALPLYDKILGPILLILGLTILLGIANRVSLFLLGLLYISLTWGLILIGQDQGVSWLGIHLILIVMALALSEHNRFAILKKW
jgi:thiosulfate dehydrogenase (quinone) large subunit